MFAYCSGLIKNHMAKIITRIKGGIGNQLFCYAAARRLALTNNAELIIDNITGFARDSLYHNTYMLHNFNIPARTATRTERLEPLERYRRGILKLLARRKPFSIRHYYEQEGLDFDARLLTLKVTDTIYLDGYWQSESYFKDVEPIIRKDLEVIAPTDAQNMRAAEAIRENTSIAIHIRWFESPDSSGSHNTSANYYNRAIALLESRISSPHYFVFSDNPDAARERLQLSDGVVTYITHNQGQMSAFADLWLMTQCQHFIIANSTFSWWGAWLASSRTKIVIAPNIVQRGISAWGFKGLIPETWTSI
jgi:hypothetical protein